MINIPTLNEIYTDILNSFQSVYGVTIPTFGKNALRAIAKAFAGVIYLVYLALGFVQKNIFPDTADSEANGGSLERFGRVLLKRNPFSATAGSYEVTVTGTIGGTIPASTTFKSDDSSSSPSFLYVLDAAYTLVSTSDTITLRALTAGIDAKLIVGDTLTVTQPVAAINRTATVTAETIEPRAAETTEDYRDKLLLAYRLAPQGGASADYILWSLDAQGVQAAYPFAVSGQAGYINLFIEATIADSTDGKGSASAGLLSDVEDVVEFNPDTSLPLTSRGRRPISAFQVNYESVTPLDIDVTITGLQNRTAATDIEIENAITAVINQVRPYVAAFPLSEKNDILDTNKLIGAILTARTGAIFTSVTMTVAGSPASTYTFINGNIPFLNSVTFI